MAPARLHKNVRRSARTRISSDMKKALGSGFIGALAVTAANQLGKRFLPQAPRLDVLGMRFASQAMRKAHVKEPPRPWLFAISLIGDLVSNSMFYGLVGAGRAKTAWLRGSLLGLLAGLGAVFLPGPIGLGNKPTNRTSGTSIFTVCWYLLGGLLAALAYCKSKPEACGSEG